MNDEEEDEIQAVRRKAERMAQRTEQSGFWRQLGSVGVMGWIFVLPIVLFMGLGHWIGRGRGTIAPALIGGVVGVLAGAWGVWRSFQRDFGSDDEEET